MYISGTMNDFASRLHSVTLESGSGAAIMALFQTEASGYVSTWSPALYNSYQKEASQRMYASSGLNPTGLLVELF